MNTTLRCSVLNWAGWMPGISSTTDWQAWAAGEQAIAATPDSPPVDFVPPMQRRRLSRLSRLSLAAAHACVGERQSLPTVFASQHGEIHRTVSLLDELARQEPLSPMAFSLSVHNTASGLYSITTGNTASSTAIAAGCDTLPTALIEVIGQLQRHDEVLLVYAEEPLPTAYSDFATPSLTLGLALLLGKPSTGTAPLLTLTLDHAANTARPGATTTDWLHWFIGGQGAIHMAGERCQWHYRWE